MPRVPTAQEQRGVQQQGVRLPGATPTPSLRGTQALTQGIQQVTNVVAAMATNSRNKADTLAVQEGMAEIQSFGTQTLHAEGGALSRKMADAVEVAPQTLTMLDDRFKTILASKNKRQQHEMTSQYRQYRLGAEVTLNRHETDQRTKYEDATLVSNLQSTLESSLDYYRDDKGSQDLRANAIFRAEKEIEDYGDDRGLPQPKIDQMKLEWSSSLLFGVTKRLLTEGLVDEAKDIMDRDDDLITNEHMTTLRDLSKPRTEEVKARGAVASMMGPVTAEDGTVTRRALGEGYKPEERAEVYAMIDTETDPNVQDKMRSEADRRFRQLDTLRADLDDAAYDGGFDHITSTGHIDGYDVEKSGRISPERKLSLIAYEAQVNKQLDVQTDEDKFYRVWESMTLPQKAAFNINLMRHYVAPARLETLRKEQNSIEAGLNSGTKTTSMTYAQQFDNRLQRYSGEVGRDRDKLAGLKPGEVGQLKWNGLEQIQQLEAVEGRRATNAEVEDILNGLFMQAFSPEPGWERYIPFIGSFFSQTSKPAGLMVDDLENPEEVDQFVFGEGNRGVPISEVSAEDEKLLRSVLGLPEGFDEVIERAMIPYKLGVLTQANARFDAIAEAAGPLGIPHQQLTAITERLDTLNEPVTLENIIEGWQLDQEHARAQDAWRNVNPEIKDNLENWRRLRQEQIDAARTTDSP